jgi:ribosomal protein S18 acetylase RimI-like enzyme
MLVIRPFDRWDTDAVLRLWERCELIRPWNNPKRDIARKLRVQPEMFLVGTVQGEIVASVMAGYEGHRGWINYLGVDPGHRRHGYGREMMEAAERLLRSVGCPKINLQVRSSNAAAIAFYERLGLVRDDVICLGKRLEHDDGAAGSASTGRVSR